MIHSCPLVIVVSFVIDHCAENTMTTITDSDCVVFYLLTNTGITWSKEPEVWWSWTLEGEDSLCKAYSSWHIKDDAGEDLEQI